MSGRGILIAGIGNIFLGDDAFGVEVAQKLAQQALPHGVHVVDFGIRGLDLAYALLDGYDAAILVDAMPRGGVPGTLYVVEPECDGLPEAMLEAHALDPVKVLRLAAAMGDPVRRILIVGCEPTLPADADDMSMGLSAPVAAAVEEAIPLILSLVDQLAVSRSEFTVSRSQSASTR
jgi:hydrogenase maturation protease